MFLPLTDMKNIHIWFPVLASVAPGIVMCLILVPILTVHEEAESTDVECLFDVEDVNRGEDTIYGLAGNCFTPRRLMETIYEYKSWMSYKELVICLLQERNRQWAKEVTGKDPGPSEECDNPYITKVEKPAVVGYEVRYDCPRHEDEEGNLTRTCKKICTTLPCTVTGVLLRQPPPQ